VGHRGVRGARPENTLSAFALAADEGADAVELDVRRCATGELVVVHDPDLERIAGDARKVAELPWTDIARADVSGERVPRLADVLALCRERGVAVNVELKHDVPDRAGVVVAAARLLSSWDQRHELVVSSFDPWMLAGLGRLAPKIPRAQLVHRSTYVPAHLVAGGLVARGLHLEASLWHGARLDRLRRRFGWIAAWTIADVAEARRLDELGADALITDVPGRILEALAAPSIP
jgi:glycerophosphoryl diester phosphodiesterase